MGQKVHPTAFRLGIIRRWDSTWFDNKNFKDKLLEDNTIRNYIRARLPQGAIARLTIERLLKRIIFTIHTARAGVVIGKGGTEVDRIREELKKITQSDVQIKINEIKRPELESLLVAESIANQLKARISYRRAMKQAMASTMRVGAQGIKIRVSGRLGGAEMARTEEYKSGRVPLHTLRGDIDYALAEAHTVYGKIGVKVWIFKGNIYEKFRDITTEVAQKSPRRSKLPKTNA